MPDYVAHVEYGIAKFYSNVLEESEFSCSGRCCQVGVQLPRMRDVGFVRSMKD